MAAAFGFNLAKSPIETIFIDANPAAAGVAFMLINVRVGLGWAATQNRTWSESQFRTVGGELCFTVTEETQGSSLGRDSTTAKSESPSVV
jgi:hypothetical protein